MVKKALYRSIMELSGNRVNSFILKKFATSPLSKTFVKSFVKTYHLDENEMEKALPEYKTLHELFTRKLKSGARTIDPNPAHVISPVDGVLASSGEITKQSQFFVKGQTYTITEMLGSMANAEKYNGGHYVILYLSPRHYHRIHSPISGQVLKQWCLGRKSYPVNEHGLTYGKRPLSRNYRMITEMKAGTKHIAVVKVGALNVNSIEATHLSDTIEKGEEMAYFTFGSTVVLLFQKDMFTLNQTFSLPAEVTMGMCIGTIKDMK